MDGHGRIKCIDCGGPMRFERQGQSTTYVFKCMKCEHVTIISALYREETSVKSLSSN